MVIKNSRKFLTVFICIILIVILLSFNSASQRITLQKTNKVQFRDMALIENRSLNISVHRYDNNELIPVKMCPVYLYVYPSKIPRVGYTNEMGYLTYEPLVYMGDDIKITAYHEWYGGNTTFHTVKVEDPNPIYFDIILDPNKSHGTFLNQFIGQQNIQQFSVPFFVQILQRLLNIR
jgi:hypothetical protein